MNGRIEHEVKTNNEIKAILKNMPGFVSEWHDNMYANNMTAITRLEYVKKIGKFLEYVRKCSCKNNISGEDITFSITTNYFVDIQNIIKNGEVTRSSGAYRCQMWAILNNFMNFMVEEGYMVKNHMSRIKKPKNKDLDRIIKNRVMLSSDDVNKVLESTLTNDDAQRRKWKNRDMAIMLLLITTGMRREALSEINISDINFGNNVLHVIDKGEKEFYYPLTDDTVFYLKNWIRDRKNYFEDEQGDQLFMGKRGGRLTSKGISYITKKYSYDALEKELSPHKFRGAFVSILYEETGDIEFVRRAVGHSNIATTQRYVVTNGNEKAEAANIMSKLLSKNS